MTSRRTAGLAALLLGFAGTRLAAQAKPQGAPAAKPAAMTAADSLIARENGLYDALAKNDYAAFNKGLGGDFVYVDGSGAVRWELAKSAENLKGCTTGKWTMKDTKVTPAGSDLMVLTYSGSGEQTCNGQKSPSPVNALSVWQRRAGGWVAIAHSETPANPPPKK
jgi:Domain of unknown function (DUF4440)